MAETRNYQLDHMVRIEVTPRGHETVWGENTQHLKVEYALTVMGLNIYTGTGLFPDIAPGKIAMMLLKKFTSAPIEGQGMTAFQKRWHEVAEHYAPRRGEDGSDLNAYEVR